MEKILMTKQIFRPENHLLKCLSDLHFDRIRPHLELIDFPLGKVIHLPYEKIEYVYFPERTIISIATTLENGCSVETGIIGSEGVLGAEVIFNEVTAGREANIQLAGTGFRMRSEVFKSEFEQDCVFRNGILSFVGTYISQISQNSACLLFHTVEQRLCRWLLMFDDRTEKCELKLTQEFIALMLGVHRPSVSKNANKLQQKGWISYNRGRIIIKDREGLESNSCECYRVGKQRRSG